MLKTCQVYLVLWYFVFACTFFSLFGCINCTPGCVHVMRVGLLVSVSLCLKKKPKKHKVNVSSPGSFWSFWPFSTSATTRGEKKIKKMFRISMLLTLSSHRGWGGGLGCLFIAGWPFWKKNQKSKSKTLLGRSALLLAVGREGEGLVGDGQTSHKHTVENGKSSLWRISIVIRSWLTGGQSTNRKDARTQTYIEIKRYWDI